MSVPVLGVTEFERFFRVAASLDVDHNDLRRYREFVNRKIHDLLVRAEAIAKANGRDVIQPFDLPITKGLQENVHAFRKLDTDVHLERVIVDLTMRPQLDLDCSSETDAQLPQIAGGVSLALAKTFKLIDPHLINPSSDHWERSFRVFDQLI